MKINELKQNVSIFINYIKYWIKKGTEFDTTQLKFRILKILCVLMDI